ncbi:hypothetical protein [Acidisoma sp. C75]
MAEPVKTLSPRNGAGFRPGAAFVAAMLSLVLLLLFWLITTAHF